MDFMNLKINKINRGAISSYTKIKKGESDDSVKKSGGKFDSVEFDFSQSVQTAKANAASRLAADMNIEKIKQLQAQYADENCPVSPESAAAALLGDAV